VLSELKNRGVADVCIVVCDGRKGLPDAVNTVWDKTIVQTCIVHYADARVMPMWLVDLLQGKGSVLVRSA
jgi:transposase-like protein